MSKPINALESVTDNKKTEAPDSQSYRESGLWSEAEQEPETLHSNECHFYNFSEGQKNCVDKHTLGFFSEEFLKGQKVTAPKKQGLIKDIDVIQ